MTLFINRLHLFSSKTGLQSIKWSMLFYYKDLLKATEMTEVCENGRTVPVGDIS